jgi:hypothetical protein
MEMMRAVTFPEFGRPFTLDASAAKIRAGEMQRCELVVAGRLDGEVAGSRSVWVAPFHKP